MSDPFQSFTDSPVGPARTATAVTPSDSAPLLRLPKALYIGGGGDVTLRCVDSSADIVLSAVPGGSVLPVRAQFVRSTGTTATAIVALG
ncbi:hypothetical protein ASE90_11710 [Sphingomonas sp. Leaf67]|uniref:spike base protein, RCAP_Rcc01079 family n=1 Tax=unclassified Sphingomonas TaxID=196159 RepID=UPI0006FEA1FB|nr:MULTISPECIES: hypothetical protein [unclassified Sphingomonas]KQN76309.1 hypothetical protein ASE91_16200 [Sphingomonas sp. Leaf62]KQN82493.1 hypothetical protein ASE90_11710 [Sphingomonas sp. Leaf67]